MLEESEEGFSLYEFYMNGKKKLDETKTREDYCFWNKLCSDVEDVFDSDGYATKPDRRIGHSSIYLARNDEIYIFGGRIENETEEVSDFWKFHILSRRWTEIYPKSESECWPAPSFDHATISVSLSQQRFENFILKNHPESIPPQPNESPPPEFQFDENSKFDSCIVEKYANQMWLFGGYNSKQNMMTLDGSHFSNQLYCFDFTFNKFFKISYQIRDEFNSTQQLDEKIENNSIIEETDRRTLKRSRHVLISVSDRYLYIIGGMTEQSKILMDVWEYDIDSNEMKCVWQHCDEESSVLNPQPRYYHSCIYSKLNHSIYMFGGIRNSEAFQDLWRFDLKEYRWFLIENMKGFVPVERFRHSCFIPNEESEYFFVYGGYNFRHSFLDYIYQFSFATFEWIQLQNRNYTQGGQFQSKGSILFVDYNEIPTARSGMSSVITRDGDLIIFGGKSVTTLNDMFVCHLPGYSKIRGMGKEVIRDRMLRQSRDCSFVDLLIRYTI